MFCTSTRAVQNYRFPSIAAVVMLTCLLALTWTLLSSAWYWQCPYYSSVRTGKNASLLYVFYCLFYNRIMLDIGPYSEYSLKYLRAVIGSEAIKQLNDLQQKLESHVEFNFIREDNYTMSSKK